MSVSETSDSKVHGLTRFPSTSLRELVALSIPLMFVFFSSTFMGFCDRWFLAYISTEAMEASMAALYLSLFFQVPCMRIASICQVFVAQNFGAGNYRAIGSHVWQMIWFSFCTMLITYPVSYLGQSLFFGGTSIESSALIYFRVMMLGNFLFPLGVSLAAFYIGQGKTKVVFLTTVCSNILNVLLNVLFIFGVPDFIPPMGIYGAALGSIIAQSAFCVTLFFFFTQPSTQEKFCVHNWQINFNSLLAQLRLGIPRAVSRIFLLGTWLFTAKVMLLKGGDYTLVLTIGGTIALLFTFIGDGMSQAMITIGSNLIGAEASNSLYKLTRSAFIFIIFSSIFFLTPLLLIYPDWLLSFFLVGDFSPTTWKTLQLSSYWLWFHFLFYGINHIGHSLLVITRDTVFHMLVVAFDFLLSFLPLYMGIHYFNISADKLWLITSIDFLVAALIFFMRYKRKQQVRII